MGSRRLVFPLYGNDKTDLSSSPVGIKWYIKNGVTFPVLVDINNCQVKDSFKIYQHLQKNRHRLCLPECSHQFQKELEKFFLSYSPKRAALGKDIKFLKGWMMMREYSSKS